MHCCVPPCLVKLTTTDASKENHSSERAKTRMRVKESSLMAAVIGGSGAIMALWWALFLLLANDVSCLAVNNAPSKIVRVVSTKKDGGLSKTFTFDVVDDTTRQLGTAAVENKRKNNGGDHSLSHGIKKIQAALRSTFLPSGYPTKTPPGYLSYSMWSWIQDVSTQLRSVLATQRVLEGVGVGREGATALSALMNFLVRDGCGMAATLIFTSTSSSRFRTDIKRWRLFADIMVDIGITLEVAATLVPRALFLPMICKCECEIVACCCCCCSSLYNV